jgi:P-loop Domain of unknown function (DUF2791)
MAGFRELMSAAILRILADGVPRKARDLVDALRGELARNDVEKHEVNSVLYRDLHDDVECDSEFRWRIRHQTTTTNESNGSVRSRRTSGEGSQRPALIRTIYRLRSGLPPVENLERLTVGQDKLTSALRSLLRPRPDGQCLWGIARGDYGHGKSHALALFSELALKEGYAVCHLSCDGFSNALNHPQRFLPSLFSTLEIPSRNTHGYTDLLYDVLSDSQLAMRLRRLAKTSLDDSSLLSLEVSTCLDLVIQILAQNQTGHSEEWTEWVRYITHDLTGDSIRHSASSLANRLSAYRLIALARDLIVELGMKGLAIAIDEVESIYTKLPNARSRQGALRVLAALCQFAHCRIAIAITPDAYEALIADLPLMLIDNHCLTLERITDWSAALVSGAVPVLECRSLASHDRLDLLTRVFDIYCETYGNGLSSSFKEAWDQYLHHAGRVQVPVRLSIRQAVDLMDSNRYSTIDNRRTSV